MSALGEAQARIDSVGKLGKVVGAMRGIAAGNQGKARAALAGYETYARVVAAGLARAAALVREPVAGASPPSPHGALLVAFAAEHGFAAAFSERVLDAVASSRQSRLVVAGTRGLALARQRGLGVEWSTPMASQVAAVGAVARRIADALYARYVDEGPFRVEVLHARPLGAAGFTVVRRTLLPIGVAAGSAPGPPPLTNLRPRHLVEQLVGEYVFAVLALAALESFASENAARLAAMESAYLNIDAKLEELRGQERLLRQEQITAEVQDVVAGALASDVG